MGRNKEDGKQRAKEIHGKKINKREKEKQKKGANEKSRQREMERREEKYIVILCRDSS